MNLENDVAPFIVPAVVLVILLIVLYRYRKFLRKNAENAPKLERHLQSKFSNMNVRIAQSGFPYVPYIGVPYPMRITGETRSKTTTRFINVKDFDMRIQVKSVNKYQMVMSANLVLPEAHPTFQAEIFNKRLPEYSVKQQIGDKIQLEDHHLDQELIVVSRQVEDTQKWLRADYSRLGRAFSDNEVFAQAKLQVDRSTAWLRVESTTHEDMWTLYNAMVNILVEADRMRLPQERQQTQRKAHFTSHREKKEVCPKCGNEMLQYESFCFFCGENTR